MIGHIIFLNKLLQENIFSRMLRPAKTYVTELKAIPGQLRKQGIRATWKGNRAFRHAIKAKGAEGALYTAYKSGYKKGSKDNKKGKI